MSSSCSEAWAWRWPHVLTSSMHGILHSRPLHTFVACCSGTVATHAQAPLPSIRAMWESSSMLPSNREWSTMRDQVQSSPITANIQLNLGLWHAKVSLLALLKRPVVWDVILCRCVNSFRRFEQSYCPHFEVETVQGAFQYVTGHLLTFYISGTSILIVSSKLYLSLSDGLFDFPAKILKSFHIWVRIIFNMSHTRWLPLKKTCL